MTGRVGLSAELTTLGIDVSKHLMEHHHRLLPEIRRDRRDPSDQVEAGQQVLVAGVRTSPRPRRSPAANASPSSRLEEGSGLVDLAFFEDSHPACARTVFPGGLPLVGGTVQIRGTRRTIVGTMAQDLDQIATARPDHGLEAALALLGADRPQPTPRSYIAHPYADLQTAGSRTAH